MNNKLLSLLLICICCAMFVHGNENYNRMVDIGMNSLRNGDYYSAYKKFDNASVFASTQQEKENREELLRLVLDSVSVIYHRGASIYKSAKSKQDYYRALSEFRKILPIDLWNNYNVYSFIGHCYENLCEPYAAIDNYAKGVTYRDSFCASRLAKLLPKYSAVPSDSIMHLYEIAATDDKSAYDSIGNMLYQSSPQEAYANYKKSGTNYGLYKISALILENKVISGEDPIRILEQLAQNDDNVAHEAQYYLGLLYFHGDAYGRIKKNQEYGLQLIRKASNAGNKDAAKWLKARNREIKRR